MNYKNIKIMKSIFLIERIWTNSMENEINSAVGYEPYGFVSTKEDAEQFCLKGRSFTRKDCWAILYEQPEYIYKEIRSLK
jgi:hypothetical protein